MFQSRLKLTHPHISHFFRDQEWNSPSKLRGIRPVTDSNTPTANGGVSSLMRSRKKQQLREQRSGWSSCSFCCKLNFTWQCCTDILLWLEGKYGKILVLSRATSHNLQGKFISVPSLVFAAKSGISAADYIRKRKLTNSFAILLDWSKSILDIAMTCGYEYEQSLSAHLMLNLILILENSAWRILFLILLHPFKIMGIIPQHWQASLQGDFTGNCTWHVCCHRQILQCRRPSIRYPFWENRYRWATDIDQKTDRIIWVLGGQAPEWKWVCT